MKTTYNVTIRDATSITNKKRKIEHSNNTVKTDQKYMFFRKNKATHIDNKQIHYFLTKTIATHIEKYKTHSF